SSYRRITVTTTGVASSSLIAGPPNAPPDYAGQGYEATSLPMSSILDHSGFVHLFWVLNNGTRSWVQHAFQTGANGDVWAEEAIDDQPIPLPLSAGTARVVPLVDQDGRLEVFVTCYDSTGYPTAYQKWQTAAGTSGNWSHGWYGLGHYDIYA